jgi:hypothetical protein
MCKSGEHDMLNFFKLTRNGLVDAWIGMPKQISPPRADAI